MAWIASVLALVAIAAISVAFRLWNQLRAEREHGSELLYARIEAENALQALHEDLAAAPTVGDSLVAVADRLDEPLDSVRAHLREVGTQLDDYRKRVGQFDLAVQYCLQPVELIFGADKAGLDELVRHVETARRRLFEARASLEKNPLHKGAHALDGGLGGIKVLTDYARALRVSPEVAAAVVGPDHAMDPQDVAAGSVD